MTKTKSKAYTAEFIESAVKLAIGSKKPMSQTAEELGIKRTTLYTWVNKYSRSKEPMMRTDEHVYEEVKRLKRELAKVTQERDLLKKAAAYFAKESQ